MHETNIGKPPLPPDEAIKVLEGTGLNYLSPNVRILTTERLERTHLIEEGKPKNVHPDVIYL